MGKSSQLFLISGLMCLLPFWAAGCRIATSNEQSPVAALIAKLLPDQPKVRRQKLLDSLSSPDADTRREGVLQLGRGEAAGWNATPNILSIMALGDQDAQVRAAAVRVLAHISDGPIVFETARKAAKDDSEMVRLASIAVLSHSSGEPELKTLLERLSQDQVGEVRAAAAAALGTYNDRRALRGLLNALEDAQFAVAYRARQSLNRLTGEDMGYDKQAWRQWLYTNNDLFRQ